MVDKKIKIIAVFINVVLLLTFILLFFPDAIFAQTYETLAPLSESQRNVDLDDPKAYFTNMFSIFVSLLAILAVIRLMLCGFQYMTSEAISSKEDAKKCIWAILGGLFLLLLSFLILTTINKDLVSLSFFDRVTNEIETRTDNDVEVQKTLSPPTGTPTQPDDPFGTGNVDPGVNF